MATKLKQLDIDPNGKQANYPEYKYPADVRNQNAAPLPEWVDPLGYNPNPMKSTDTNINNTAELSEGQRLQQNDAVVFNNNKRQNYANADNGMPGGVIPATETPAQRSEKIFQQNHGGVTASGLVNGNGVYEYNGVPTQIPTGYTDINALTDRLRADQEAERAKFERKRMADRISRMGFALGNLIGAKGGSTDASAITLDDGTKQVGEYRKDMEDINKQNMDAYQRALEQIYRKEDQDYKNAVFQDKKEQDEKENKRKDKETDAKVESYKALANQRNVSAETGLMKAQAYVDKLASDMEKNKKYGDAAAVRAAAQALRAGDYVTHNRAMEDLAARGVIKEYDKVDEYGNTQHIVVTTRKEVSSANGGTKGTLYTPTGQQKPKGNGKKLYDNKQQK